MGTYNIQNDMKDGDAGHIPWGVAVANAINDLDVRVALGIPGTSAYQLAVDLGFVGTEAQWIASLHGVKGDLAGPAEIAAAQGYWPIYSATPPTQTTMYGVPVVWIDSTSVVTPIPVNPALPTWDDATSKFTVPAAQIGLDYYWTSGSGGAGQKLTPGAILGTTGAFPRTVVITAVAKPGYVLAAGVRPFAHDFPDPAAVTVLTSDGFGGTAATGITGRAFDLALGGTLSQTWSDGGAWNIDGSGHAVASSTPGGFCGTTIAPAHQNTRLEVDLVALAEEIEIAIRNSTGNRVVALVLKPGSADGYVSNPSGGSVDLGSVAASGPALVAQAGLWTIQLYLTTLTITDPAGHVRSWDLSGSGYAVPSDLASRTIWVRKYSTGTGTSLNSVKISKVGF